MMDLLRRQLENQFLSGGLVLVLFTGLLAAMRKFPEYLWHFIERRFVTIVDISDHDPAFFWVQTWLSTHEYTKRSRLLTASTRTRPVGYSPQEKEEDQFSRKKQLTEVLFSPAPGTHLFRFHGHFILLTRTRTQGEGTMGELAFHETIVFKTFSKNVIRDLIFDARHSAFPPDDNRVAVLRSQWNQWQLAQRKVPRNLDSIVLADNTANELLADLKWFFGASKWFSDHGIPYQRGYMLAGPPGSGKTSLVVAIASAFDRDIYIINLASTSDANLVSLTCSLPEHAIVLIEDIDGGFVQRDKVVGPDQLSFSGFINAIDGVSASTGRILFMTTNHIEKIDPALLRPGRADRIFNFGPATPDMAYRFYLKFFPGEPELASQFSATYGKTPPSSMADLQEHLIRYREDSTGAVTNVGNLVRSN